MSCPEQIVQLLTVNTGLIIIDPCVKGWVGCMRNLGLIPSGDIMYTYILGPIKKKKGIIFGPEFFPAHCTTPNVWSLLDKIFT